MQFSLGFGTTVQTVTVEDSRIIGVLTANEFTPPVSEEAPVREALAHPIGTPPLREIVHPGETIAIISSDITRPMPTWKVMPALLDELYAAGADPKDITLVFALGSHRHHSEEERRHLAGDRAYAEIRCVDSDPDDCVSFGVTRRGTPVDITRVVAQADRRILLGNIEYHYFAGYSGGAKAIMPGASTPAAIQQNHRLMVEPGCVTGNIDGNVLRADLEEAARMVGADFILNLVLDEHKHIVHAVAGDMIEAHRVGCRLLDGLYEKPIPARADIVIVSQGGAPKDLNLYQVQKALDNAKHAVKPGGAILLVGACPEGLGNATFAQWMTEAEKPEDIVARLRRGFRLGGHKAAAIAMVMREAAIYLVSEMDPELVKNIFMIPCATLQEAYDRALSTRPEATVLVMPYGGSTLPRVKEVTP